MAVGEEEVENSIKIGVMLLKFIVPPAAPTNKFLLPVVVVLCMGLCGHSCRIKNVMLTCYADAWQMKQIMAIKHLN